MVYKCPICNRTYATATEMANCALKCDEKLSKTQVAEKAKAKAEAKRNAQIEAERLARKMDELCEEIKKNAEQYNYLVKKYYLDLPTVSMNRSDNKEAFDEYNELSPFDQELIKIGLIAGVPLEEAVKSLKEAKEEAEKSFKKEKKEENPLDELAKALGI